MVLPMGSAMRRQRSSRCVSVPHWWPPRPPACSLVPPFRRSSPAASDQEPRWAVPPPRCSARIRSAQQRARPWRASCFPNGWASTEATAWAFWRWLLPVRWDGHGLAAPRPGASGKNGGRRKGWIRKSIPRSSHMSSRALRLDFGVGQGVNKIDLRSPPTGGAGRGKPTGLY